MWQAWGSGASFVAVVMVALYGLIQLIGWLIRPAPAENLDPNQSAYRPYTPAEQALMDRENTRMEAALQSAQADRAKRSEDRKKPETVRVRLSEEDYDAVLVKSLQAHPSSSLPCPALPACWL